MDSFIQNFGILFLIIVAVSFIVKLFRQPIIIGYVISGLLFSILIEHKIVLGESTGGMIIAISELGLMFLLFLMGLEFDLRNLKYLGKDLLIATLLQSAIFFIIAGIPAYFFGYSIMDNIYLAIIFMFSSTLLVAKWVEDKKETSSLHGKIILGILILQDLIAIIALTFLGAIKEQSILKIFLVPFKGFALLIIAFLFTRYMLNRLLKIVVRYPELLFIFGLGICFLFVEISPLLGYSTTIGAFIAGVTIANTNYKNDIHSRLKSLIIFFNMLFFVGLGFQMKLNLGLNTVLFIALLCALSLFIKPIVIYLTLRNRGYDIKTSFISGISLAQLSEFGIIIVAAGIMSGMVSDSIGTIAVISVIITMILSSYLIKYDKKIYKYLENKIKKIDKRLPTKEQKSEKVDLSGYNILFFGYYDISKELFGKLKGLGKRILVIENDPTNIQLLKRENIPFTYNSIANPDFFEKLNFANVELIISSLMDIEDNKMIIRQLKRDNPKAAAIVTAKSFKDSLDLYDSKADYVICPSYLNEKQVSILLEDYSTDINKVISKKIEDITKLRELDQKRKSAAESTKFIDIEVFLKKLSQPSAKQKDKDEMPYL